MKIDRRIREFLNTRVSLRSDLVITTRQDSGDVWFSVEDPVRGKFYRIGHRERELLRLLDGRRTLGEILEVLATTTPKLAVSEAEAETICRWLESKQLVESGQPVRSARESSRETRKTQTLRNPLLFKVPVLNPDRPLALAERYVGWMFGPIGVSIWLAFVATATMLLVTRLGDVQQGAGGVLARGNWLWLGLTWCVLKICHECAHGIVCRRYGGPVNEAGLMFIVLAPLAYIDLTSAWRFRSKWQRIHTAVAGIYAEVFIAALAAIVWCCTSIGIVNQLSFNVMLMAGVATLLFNANPLMRFDGYYVLTDLLEVPNLYGQSAAWWRSVVARFFFGTPISARLTRPVFQRVYGVLAMLWRVFVTASMLLAASVLFEGLGVLLAVVGLVAFVAPTALRLGQMLLQTTPGVGRASRIRFTLASTAVAAFALALFVGIPWFGTQSAPAIVEDSELVVVRSAGHGFVSEVRCQAGDRVNKGDVLLVLENDEFETQVHELQVQIAKAELTAREHQIAQRHAKYQSEMEGVASLRSQLAERVEQQKKLTVEAPRDGIVIGRELDTLVGRFVQTGEKLLQVGPQKSNELVVSIAQADVERFTSWQGKSVSVWLASGVRLDGTLGEVEPNTESTVNHAAMLAPYGGPLPVVERRDPEQRDAAEVRYELLDPRLKALVHFPGAQYGYLGQRAEIRFRPFDESMGKHVIRVARNWLRGKLRDLTA